MKQEERESFVEERVSVKSVTSSDDEKVGFLHSMTFHIIVIVLTTEQTGKNTEKRVGV